MGQDLYRLVYYSRNRGSIDPAASGEVRDILSASRRNNAEADVTGALLFNAGCFGQVLEGPRRAVEATFERIQQDPRHGDVTVLGFGEAEGRCFGNWSMAFVGERQDHAASYGDIASESGFDPSRMTGDALFATLRQLAIDEERVGGGQPRRAA
jgi:hypothetical protein